MANLGEQFQLLLNAPQIAEAIMRAFGLKGDLPRPVRGEYQLIAKVADLTLPEYAWLQRASLWNRGSSQSAVAGEFPIFSFATRVAAQSRSVMAIVDQVLITNNAAAAQTFLVGVSINGSGIADPGSANLPRDDRIFTTGAQSSFAVGNGTNPVNPLVGLGAMQFDIPAGGTFMVPGPWILTNNSNAVFRTNLLVVGNTVNTSARCTFWWRERLCIDSEL